MRTLRVSEKAALDMDRIFDYWANRATPEVAAKLIRSIESRFTTIVHTPSVGRKAMLSGSELFVFPASQYLIYYQKAPRHILIVRVLHGARDQDSALRTPVQLIPRQHWPATHFLTHRAPPLKLPESSLHPTPKAIALNAGQA